MFIKKAVVGSLVSLGFAFGMVSGKADSEMTHSMPNRFDKLNSGT